MCAAYVIIYLSKKEMIALEKYIEVAVPRKNSVKDYALCFVCCMLPILLGTYLVMMIYSATRDFMLVGLSCVLCAGLYFLAYKIFCNFAVDWEYTLVDDEIRFAKIINRAKRRDITTVQLSKVEAVAKITDNEHIGALRASIEKKYSFISQTTDDYYFLVGIDKNGKRVCIFFEPDERMCENFKTTLRGKFFE